MIAFRRASQVRIPPGFLFSVCPDPPVEANPFAKKSTNVVEATANGKPNPFARKLTSTKSLHKSETFFEKVDAAESEAEKGKRKFYPQVI